MPDDHYSIEIMAKDTVDIMDKIVKSVHFLGISMGSRIAQVIAAKYPERVKSLILNVAAAGFPDMFKSILDVSLENMDLRKTTSKNRNNIYTEIPT